MRQINNNDNYNHYKLIKKQYQNSNDLFDTAYWIPKLIVLAQEKTIGLLNTLFKFYKSNNKTQLNHDIIIDDNNTKDFLNQNIDFLNDLKNYDENYIWYINKSQDDLELLNGYKNNIEFKRSKSEINIQSYLNHKKQMHNTYSIIKPEIYLANVDHLKPHQEIISWERVAKIRKSISKWDAITQPLLVDSITGTIIDGHHQFYAAIQLQLKRLPVILIDYLNDASISVDTWPRALIKTVTKQSVVKSALEGPMLPSKTTRHRYAEALPPIQVNLSILKKDRTLSNATARRRLKRSSSLVKLIKKLSIKSIGALRQIFERRARNNDTKSKVLDIVSLINSDAPFFNIRRNDPSSTFCKTRSITIEDLMINDLEAKKNFFITRVTDPTSYFYRYRFDCFRQSNPERQTVELVDISWLKRHEEVVSWERVLSLKQATIRWDAYLEPLLVDVVTGAILDGHHRYHVGKLLGLDRLPAVMVDYLHDNSISVDIWPDCGRSSITKEEVIAMSLSDEVFPPKTSKHIIQKGLPPISIPLQRLRY